MKKSYRYTIFFVLFYVFASVVSTMLTFSWTAFGVRNSMNIIQKIILFFLGFLLTVLMSIVL